MYKRQINPTVKAVPVATGSVEGRLTTAGVSAGGKKVSLRMMTLDNKKQKVNDLLGNPVEIGAVVIWRVVDPTKMCIRDRPGGAGTAEALQYQSPG